MLLNSKKRPNEKGQQEFRLPLAKKTQHDSSNAFRSSFIFWGFNAFRSLFAREFAVQSGIVADGYGHCPS
jgi:hypothetical protein